MNKYQSHLEKRTLRIIAICLVTLLLVACNTSYVEESDDSTVVGSDPTVTTDELDVTTYVVEEVPVAYTSIPELSNMSDIIIIGKIISAGNIINMARDVNTAKPDPNYFGIGQTYKVEIESYLKGDGDKIIEFVQYQGFIITGLTNPPIDEIEKVKSETDYIHLDKNQKLLMFLDKSPYEYREYTRAPLFISVGHPSLFDITDPECVQPLDTLIDIHKYFPPKSFITFAQQINEPFDVSSKPEAFPYPPPETLDRCSDKSSNPYP